MELTFLESPVVEIATNKFIDVPILIQYNETPLLEVCKEVEAGYSISFPVYDKDGRQIARVKGSSIHPTSDEFEGRIGKREEPQLTVILLDGKPILEMRRTEAQALKTWAQLYTPEGVLIKAADSGVSGLLRSGGALTLGDSILRRNIFQGCRIGIKIVDNGISQGLALGCG
jgi:hypothetical protein